MKLLRSIFDFLIQCNLWIAMAAVCFTIQTQVELGLAPQLHPYLFLILFATLFEYNLHRFITSIRNGTALQQVKHEWLRENKKIFYLVFFISIIGFCVACLLAKTKVLLILFPLGIATVLYSFPFPVAKKTIFRLREIPGAKIFIISLVWAGSTVLLPVIQSEKEFGLTDVTWLLAERFLFIFAITLPFDIRDIANDKRAGLVTLPLILGEQRTLFISQLILVAFSLVCCFHYISSHSTYLLLPLIASSLTTMFCIGNKRMQKLPHYHYGILDGTIVLQSLAALLMYYLIK